jgi:eukaryotic-like serine/threonine-protein kinase
MSMTAVEVSTIRSPSRILHDPLPGTGYRALRRLGAGSTAEVFEAIGPQRTPCAVKVLRSVFADMPDAVFRMEQEAVALAAIDHPGIPPVLDEGITAAGRPYFVMPRLSGETLRERLAREGRLPADEACAILVEVLEALDAAHRAGVVHRDVKPGNVFLPRAGSARGRRALVLDFGLAKLLAHPDRATTDPRVVGTPRYLAPEQILGGQVDARTDVYAAGILLFEAVAGRWPFDADGPVEPMRAHLAQEPLRLAALVNVAAELDRAVARALAKAPAQRWPSARAFAAALERAQGSARRLSREIAS